MNTFAKDFKAAFGSVWALLGVIISAVAVFNWLSRFLKLGLSDLFHQLLTAFRAVFHPIIEFLIGWAIPYLPFLQLPEWKDGMILWFAIGGAVARTFVSLTFKLIEARSGFLVGPLGIFTHNTWLWPIGLLIAILVWPLMLGLFWFEPIVAKATTNLSSYIIYGGHMKGFLKEDGTYDHDLRVVFALQLTAVIAVVAILTLLNAAGVG